MESDETYPMTQVVRGPPFECKGRRARDAFAKFPQGVVAVHTLPAQHFHTPGPVGKTIGDDRQVVAVSLLHKRTCALKQTVEDFQQYATFVLRVGQVEKRP